MSSELKDKAIKGMSWASLERIGSQVVQFVLSILIARILLPEDYGIIGMLAIFMALAQTFLDSGFANALIQKKDRNEVDYSTAFYFNVAIALAIYLLLCLMAPLIARFYNMPILVDVIRVYMFTLVLNGLSIVQTAKLSIELRFKSQAIISILSVLISGILGLVMAKSGYGCWALVGQSLSAAGIRWLGLAIYTRWMPLAVFSVKSFKSLFSFGSKLLVSGTINTIYNNISTIIIGKCFNAVDLGFFTRANQFASIAPQTVTDISLKVGYPILSTMQDDNEKLLAAYKKLLKAPLFILYPALIGFIVLAEPTVKLLVGEKWLPCVPFLRILCFVGLWTPLTMINLNLLYVKGRTDLVLKLEFIKKPLAFVLLFAAIPFGIDAICWSLAIYALIAYTLNCHYTRKLLNYGLAKQLREIVPVLGYCAIMSAALCGVMLLFSNPYIRVSVGIFVGIAVYLGSAIMFKDNIASELLSTVKRKLLK